MNTTMQQNVRVRIAPSPTGEPHVGNIRTALFNWLFARRSNGAFIVRIEDTDRERYTEGAIEQILESLRWLGLDWDEGPDVGGPFAPYIQSQRLDIYHSSAQRLLEQGYAYYCYCSPERLDEVRREQARQGKPPGYDRRCRDLSGEERQRLEASMDRKVVRFRVPLSGETRVHDLIRGEVTWRNELLDDFVILKSDGYPTYHLASVLDDHLMEITHVLRAEEWLSSTPRHLMLYRALDFEPPLFGHLPMILGQDRSKLSKRHGATSVLAYRDMGYLPEALVNFLALLGWSLDDKTEVIAPQVLRQHFSLDRVTKAGAIFNQEKLTWLNGVYIRQLSTEELARRLLPFLEQDPSTSLRAEALKAEGSERGLPPGVPRPIDRSYVLKIVPLVQERLKTLAEGPELMSFFFQEELEYDSSDLIQKGMDRESTTLALEKSLKVIESASPFEAPTLEEKLRALGAELGLSGRQLFGVLRVATTGRTAAPPLFETMEVLGKERCVNRIKRAIQRVSQPSN